MWRKPKIGDRVKINPEFIKYLRNKVSFWFMKPTGWPIQLEKLMISKETVEIKEVLCPIFKSLQYVQIIIDKVNWVFDISHDGKFYFFNQDENCPIVFLYEDESIIGIDFAVSAKDKVRDLLKNKNTEPYRLVCYACGGKLKDPGLGPIYKHCPKCEP